jgi:predicted phage terminase large subunit-like protein
MLELRPQAKQEAFLASSADLTIFGGSAFVGKTWSLLLEPLYHVHNPEFGAVFFRRTYARVTQEGGMLDESARLYRPLHAELNKTELAWRFPSGASVSFAHLQHEGDEYAYYGAQICLLCFDQIEEFSEHQVFYMLGRNRSTCGVRPYCKATCNPLPDSWLSRFLAWWIDEDTGYPIPERAGKTRWFIRLPSDELAWGDSPEHLAQLYGTGIFPKSVAFIPGTLEDNPIGRQLDPAYEANLMLQVGYLRERLRYGNWKARPSAGQFFKRHWFDLVDVAPVGLAKVVRYWDRAATEPSPMDPDPDWTSGFKIGLGVDGYYYMLDVRRERLGPAGVERLIVHTAKEDGVNVEIGLEQEPGASGKTEAFYLARQLAGYRVRVYPKRIDKPTAAAPLASQAEIGNVRMVRAPWNKDVLDQYENFPEGRHDDDVDSGSGAFAVLAGTAKGHSLGGPWAPVGA